MSLTLFIVGYFGFVVSAPAESRRLLDAIGKVLTPVLVPLLVVLAIGVLVAPRARFPAASGEYLANLGVKGIAGGYKHHGYIWRLNVRYAGLLMYLGKRGISDSRLR